MLTDMLTDQTQKELPVCKIQVSLCSFITGDNVMIGCESNVVKRPE